MKFLAAVVVGSIVGLLITQGHAPAGPSDSSDAADASAAPAESAPYLDGASAEVAAARALLAFEDGPDEVAPARVASAGGGDAVALSAELVSGAAVRARASLAAGSESPLSAGSGAAAPATRLPPLTADDPYWRVPVDGFGEAVVWLPLGTTTPRPLVVATHGNYDRPEWVCERWSYVMPDAFVVCPRGIRRSTERGHTQRYHHRSRRYLDEELDALMPLVEARFGERIAEGSRLYTGFSQGAIFGQRFIVREPERFSHAVLASGGDEWSRSEAEAFAEGGGEAVLFVCGQAECARNSERAVGYLRELGVRADLIYHQGAGHTYDMDMLRDTIARLPWLFEDDARWNTGDHARHWVRADLVDD